MNPNVPTARGKFTAQFIIRSLNADESNTLWLALALDAFEEAERERCAQVASREGTEWAANCIRGQGAQG